MSAMNTPPSRGQHCTLKIFSNGVPVYIPVKNWSIEQSATEAADGVNGEIRDRLDLITNYFSGSIDIYITDVAVFQMMIAQQENDDAGAFPFAQSASVRFQFKDGTRAAFRLKNAKFGPWSHSSAGRNEANMITLKFRCQDFEQVQAI